MEKLKIEYVKISALRSPEYNPRRWTPEATAQITESIKRFGMVDPVLVNSNPARKGIVIGGNFRKKILSELGIKEVPCVFIDIADVEKEKELNGRLNRNTGEWDFDLLKGHFSEDLLKDIGFESIELDTIFQAEPISEKELLYFKKHHILISVKYEDIYKIKKIINELRKIEGVEIETSEN